MLCHPPFFAFLKIAFAAFSFSFFWAGVISFANFEKDVTGFHLFSLLVAIEVFLVIRFDVRCCGVTSTHYFGEQVFSQHIRFEVGLHVFNTLARSLEVFLKIFLLYRIVFCAQRAWHRDLQQRL